MPLKAVLESPHIVNDIFKHWDTLSAGGIRLIRGRPKIHQTYLNKVFTGLKSKN